MSRIDDSINAADWASDPSPPAAPPSEAGREEARAALNNHIRGGKRNVLRSAEQTYAPDDDIIVLRCRDFDALAARIEALEREREEWESIARTNFADYQAANDELRAARDALARTVEGMRQDSADLAWLAACPDAVQWVGASSGEPGRWHAQTGHTFKPCDSLAEAIKTAREWALALTSAPIGTTGTDTRRDSSTPDVKR